MMIDRMHRSDIVISIPHAGTDIPPDIRSRMPHSDEVLLKEPDLYTDRIYHVEGVKTVMSPWSRLIGDCNRAPDEIYTEGRLRASGVIILSQADGFDVFESDPAISEMEEWIVRFHTPYHDALTAALFDAKFLIDGHSMASVGAPGHIDPGHERADIELGNREYCSCSAETTQFFRRYFEEFGYSVAVNDPYSGRYILGTYCSRLRTPGIQIEVNRKLYLNEETHEPFDDVITRLNAEMHTLVDRFIDWYGETAPADEKPMTDLSE